MPDDRTSLFARIARSLAGPALALAALSQLAPVGAPQALPGSPWGLRNLETLPASGNFEVADFEDHGARFCHGWVLWSQIEPSQGNYQWAVLDDRIDTANQLNAIPVILLHMDAAWVKSTVFSGPYDLQAEWPVSQATPEQGYSQILWNTTQALVTQIATKYPSGELYLRFHNEPYQDWNLGSNWTLNIENYERCVRTFRKAAVVKGQQLGLDVKVSHGGQPRFRQFAKWLYEWGENGTNEDKEAALDWANFLLERQIWNGGNDPFPDWPSFAANASLTGYNATINAIDDFWLERHYQWARDNGWKKMLDYEDVHPHGKPMAILADRSIYAQKVGPVAEPLPFFSIEAAIQVAISSNWPYFTDYDFQAEDLVRKWFTMIKVRDIGFCSPAIGKPPQNYLGLLNGTATVGLPANDAFAFWANRVVPANAPNSVIKVSEQTPGLIQYRIINNEALDTKVDVAWVAALRDADTSTATAVMPKPFGGFTKADHYDALGNLIASHDPAPAQLVLTVDQAPQVVIWSR